MSYSLTFEPDCGINKPRNIKNLKICSCPDEAIVKNKFLIFGRIQADNVALVASLVFFVSAVFGAYFVAFPAMMLSFIHTKTFSSVNSWK